MPEAHAYVPGPWEDDETLQAIQEYAQTCKEPLSHTEAFLLGAVSILASQVRFLTDAHRQRRRHA